MATGKTDRCQVNLGNRIVQSGKDDFTPDLSGALRFVGRVPRLLGGANSLRVQAQRSDLLLATTTFGQLWSAACYFVEREPAATKLTMMPKQVSSIVH